MPAASPPKAAPVGPPHRRWLRRCLIAIGVLLLLLVVFHRPLGHRALMHFGGRALAKAGLTGKWKSSGNLFGGLKLDDLQLEGDPTSQVRSLTVQHAEVNYDLAALRGGGAGKVLKKLVVQNVEAEIDMTLPGSSRQTIAEPTNQKPQLPALILPEVRIENLTLRMRTAKDELLVRNFSLVLDPAKPGYIQATELNIPGAPPMANVKGITRTTLTTLSLEQVSLYPDLMLESLVVDVANLPQDEAKFSLVARQGDARLEVSGHSGSWFTGMTADAVLTIANIDQGTLAFWGVPAGSVTWGANQIALKVKGPVLRPDLLALDLTLNGGRMSWPEVILNPIDLAAATGAGKFTLAKFEATSGGNSASAQGTAALPSTWADIPRVAGSLDLTFAAPFLDQLLPASAAVSGAATGKARIAFANKTLTESAAEVAANALRIKGVPVESATTSLRLDGEVLKLEQSNIRLNAQNTLEASGQLGLKGARNLAIKWNANAQDLTTVPAEVREGLIWPTAGRVKSEGTASGSLTEWQAGEWKSLNADVGVNAQGIRIKDAAVESLTVKAEVKDGAVNVTQGVVKWDESNFLTLIGALQLTDSSLPMTADMVLELPNLTKVSAWSQQFKGPALQGGAVAVDWKGSGGLKPLKLQGEGSALVKGLKLEGVPEVLGLSANLVQAGSDMQLKEFKASAGPWRAEGSAYYDGWHLTVPALRAFVKNERLVDLSARVPVRASGVAQDSPIALRLKVDQLDAARLATALGREFPVLGVLSADGDIGGTLETLEGSLNVSATRIKPVRPTGPKTEPAEVKLTALVKQGKLTLNGTAVQRPLQPLTISANLPLNIPALLADSNMVGSLPLSAQVRLPSSSLAFLPSWVPQLRSVEGTAAADISVTGTVGKPVWQGRVTVTAPQAAFISGSLPTVKDVALMLRVEERRVFVEQASVMLAGGKLSVTGGAVLDNPADPALDIRLAAEEILLVRDENLSLRANARITCAGRLSLASVKGQVDLVRGRVFKEIEFLPLSLPNDLPPPPPPTTLAKQGGPALPAPFDKWNFDIAIKTRDPIRLMGNVAKGNAVADLRFAGLGANPDLTGKVRLEDMWLKLPYSRLTITNGEVSFNKEQPFDPQIDITGESITGSRIVQVFVQGRALDPKVRLTSSPPLPEGEIASLLATGVTTSDLSSGGGDEAAGRAAFVLLKQTYRKMFGKADVDTDDEEPPRLSFEFSFFGSDPTRRGISAVYELNPKWRIIGRVGETGTFRGLLHYLIRFR